MVLVVGTDKITKTEFERILEQATQPQPGQPKPAMTPEGRHKIAESLAELLVLAQEARKEKIDQKPDVKVQLMLRSDQILASTLFQQINAGIMPDPTAERAYYDEHKNDYETVSARHILIRMKGSAVPVRDGQKDLTDDEALAKAKDIRAKLVGGAKFDELAKAESDDVGSGANGGELGDFTRGRMVPQFEEAAFALKPGEISEPVKTQFGYHVILVEKHDAKKFEDVQPEISEKVKPELAQKKLDEMKSKTTINFDKDYFGR